MMMKVVSPVKKYRVSQQQRLNLRSTRTVRPGGECSRGRANVLREGLSRHNPRGTVPSRAVEASPEVEEDHGDNATRGEGSTRVVGGVGDGDVGCDGVHAKRASNASDQKQLPATVAVDTIRYEEHVSGALGQEAVKLTGTATKRERKGISGYRRHR